ncbi:MAG: hypothetical protein IIY58_02265, partial [Aeriscardovia sp.]|nr:hypothetical protein [Aeriscardovia sp.]
LSPLRERGVLGRMRCGSNGGSATEIPDKFPRWGVFSKEWQETACQVAALRKAEKAPIPPEPKEN